jgi:small redox-active disulfide protein 2
MLNLRHQEVQKLYLKAKPERRAFEFKRKNQILTCSALSPPWRLSAGMFLLVSRWPNPKRRLTMKKIQILGTGCAKCQKLSENAKQAADALGLEYEMEKVTDINKIMSFGVMTTPGLALDGKVLVNGKVASPAEIEKLLG